MHLVFVALLARVLTASYSSVLKIMATCGCVQDNPGCLKSCVECLGALILRLFGVISIIWLAFGISLSVSPTVSFVGNDKRQRGVPLQGLCNHSLSETYVSLTRLLDHCTMSTKTLLNMIGLRLLDI